MGPLVRFLPNRFRAGKRVSLSFNVARNARILPQNADLARFLNEGRPGFRDHSAIIPDHSSPSPDNPDAPALARCFQASCALGALGPPRVDAPRATADGEAQPEAAGDIGAHDPGGSRRTGMAQEKTEPIAGDRAQPRGTRGSARSQGWADSSMISDFGLEPSRATKVPGKSSEEWVESDAEGHLHRR